MNSAILSPPPLNISLLDKPPPKITPFLINSSFSLKSFSPWHPLPVPALRVFRRFNFAAAAADDDDDDYDDHVDNSQHSSLKRNKNGLDLAVAKPITARALFYLFIGILCPFPGFQKPALASVSDAPSATVLNDDSEKKGYARRFLGFVSQQVKIFKESFDVGFVEGGLKEFRRAKGAMQEELMGGIYSELTVLKGEKEALIDRCEEILGKSFKKSLMEKEYNEILEKIGQIELLIERKETMALYVGVTKLLPMEREFEALVRDLLSKTQSTSKPPVTKLSEGEEGQSELQQANRKFQEQMILSEDEEFLSSADSTDFARWIRRVLRDSKEMEIKLEAEMGLKESYLEDPELGKRYVPERQELIALGEAVRTESKHLSAIASLPSINYQSRDAQEWSSDSCVICRLGYEDGEALTLLSCKHLYHPECINNWLKINKACPVCSTDVLTRSGES